MVELVVLVVGNGRDGGSKGQKASNLDGGRHVDCCRGQVIGVVRVLVVGIVEQLKADAANLSANNGLLTSSRERRSQSDKRMYRAKVLKGMADNDRVCVSPSE